MLPKYLVEAEKYVQMNLHPNQIGGVRRGGVILTLLTVNGIQTLQAVFARKKVIINWICQGKRD